MPWYFPFQALSGGSQTSNLMSESADGLSTPSTRQNGLFTDIGVGGSFPATLKGGATLVAADIVASPKFLPAKPWQSAAAALPTPKARAPLTIAVQAAVRLGTTFDMFRSRVAFIELFGTESRTAHHHRRDDGRKRGMRAYRNGVLSMTKMRTAADRLRTRRRPGHGIEPHDILDVAPKVT
jgi:hypothetical protein